MAKQKRAKRVGSARASGDSATRGIKRVATGRRGTVPVSRRGTGTTKRRSA